MKVFIEEQRFTQSWIIMLLVISSIFPIALVAKEIIESKGEDMNAIITMVIVLVTLTLSFWLVLSLKLKTRIDENGIYYRFIPFHFSDRFIAWNEIKEVYVRKYDAFSEYGGWGMRTLKLWNKEKGIAYNVSGDKGIQLILRNEKKILIGTRKKHLVDRVLATYKDKINNNEN